MRELDQSPDMESISAEKLAQELHEAGREAVERGNTVAADKGVSEPRKFMEWDEITENARDGRRIQAEWFLERYHVSPRD